MLCIVYWLNMFAFIAYSQSNFVTICGNEFCLNGEKFPIIATSMAYWFSMSNETMEHNIKQMKSNGFNTLRIVLLCAQVSNYGNGPLPFNFVPILFNDTQLWMRFNLSINLAEKYGLKIFVETGDIKQCFYANHTNPWFHNNTNTVKVRQLWADVFAQLIPKYSNNPTIIGYSVLNEHLPYGNCTGNNAWVCAFGEDFISFVDFAINEIRQYDTTHLVGADGFLHLSNYSGGEPFSDGTTPGYHRYSHFDYYYDIWNDSKVQWGGLHMYPSNNLYSETFPFGEWNNFDTYKQFIMMKNNKPMLVECGDSYGQVSQNNALDYAQDIYNEYTNISGLLLWNFNCNVHATNYDVCYPDNPQISNDVLKKLIPNCCNY
eukprot:98166_1